jgi:predicted ATPase/tetratricopeptide (TPR) repeat protein
MEVEERLQTSRLVTVVGSGGMGKTRLALEIIRRQNGGVTRDTEMAFISFESVTDNSEGAVLDAMVSGLRLIPGDTGGLRGALLKRLRDASMILVLDNCETARSNIAPIVRELLNQCPKLKFLATSQHQLGLTGGLEAVYELPPLSVPDERAGSLDALQTLESYELFVTRARMAADSWMPEKDSLPSLRRLLQLTDGIPLAIEIVAAWAPIVSLAQICEDLDQTPFARVTEFDEYSSVASERHRSMLRCLEWSFTHLSKTSPKDADGFNRLGVFAGRFTEDAVGEICEVEAPRELLARLVKMSLLHSCLGTEPRRYSMLRFTRAFAQGKARTLGIEQVLIERHVNFFLKLAFTSNEKGAWEAEPLASFDNDWSDMVAAANAAPLVGNLQAVWQISRALGPFLKQRGFWTERERLNWAAVKAASDANYWAALERAHIDLGIILEAQGLWEKAAEQYRRSLFFSNRNTVTPNPNNRAMALEHLATVLSRLNDTDGAARARMKLSEIAVLLGPFAQARSLDVEGRLFEGDGDLVNAEAKYREAFRIRVSIGDENGLARSWSNIGTILTLRGVWDEAEDALRESLSFWTTRSMSAESGVVLYLLADLFRRQKRYDEAKENCEQSVKCRGNDPKGRAVTLSLLAKICRSQRDFGNALVALQQSRELCRSIGDPEGESISLDDIGTLYVSQRQLDEALKTFNESLRLKESNSRYDVVGLGITLDRIAKLHVECGNFSQAKTAYLASLQHLQAAGRRKSAAVTLTNLAMLQASQGYKQEAIQTLENAVECLTTEQTGKGLLVYAQNLLSGLKSKMKEGGSYGNLLDGEYGECYNELRNQFLDLRNSRRWNEIAVSCETLASTYEDEGKQMQAGMVFNELSEAYRYLSDFEKSEATAQRALSIYKNLKIQRGIAASLHKLGLGCAAQQKWDDAIRFYSQSLEIRVKHCSEIEEAISKDRLAMACIGAGRYTEAEAWAKGSWETAKKGKSALQKWHPLICLLWLSAERGSDEAIVISDHLCDAMKKYKKYLAVAERLCVMTKSKDWDSVKNLLIEYEIVGPSGIQSDVKPVEVPSNTVLLASNLDVETTLTDISGQTADGKRADIAKRQQSSRTPPKIEFLRNHPPKVRVNGSDLKLPSNRCYAILLLLAESHTSDKPAPQLQASLLEPLVKILNELPDRFNLPLTGRDENFRERCKSANKVAFQATPGKPDTPIASILSDLRKGLRKLLTSNDQSESTAAHNLLGYLPDKGNAFQLRGVTSGEVKLQKGQSRSV